MSMSISTAQARTKCGSRSSHDLGARHFPWGFSHRMALLKCPCPFRLHRLAQSVGRGLMMVSGPAWGIHVRSLWEILRRSWWSPLYEVLACSCTAPYKKILSEIRMKSSLVRSLCPNLMKIPLKSSKRSLHDLAQVLMKRPCEDPAEIL